MKEQRHNAATGETELVDLPAPTLADQKAVKTEAVKARFAAVLLGGFSYDFAGTTHRLDMRDANDQANWLTLRDDCRDLIAAGSGAQTVHIRSADNVTFAVTAQEAFDFTAAMRAWGKAAYARKWALEAEIEAAQSEAALNAIDLAAGWP
jgi:hypothetical protein